jgi:hypothetical protein
MNAGAGEWKPSWMTKEAPQQEASAGVPTASGLMPPRAPITIGKAKGGPITLGKAKAGSTPGAVFITLPIFIHISVR